MNSLGRLLRTSVLGESHGKKVGILIDGCPAGIELKEEDFIEDLEKRKGGTPGTTQRVERDKVNIQSGVFNGYTSGSPILIDFKNDDIRSSDYKNIANIPRPGHADFAATNKYAGFNDYRGGGHFSGRLTVAIVAAGVIAKKVIEKVEISTKILEAGGSENHTEAAAKAQKQGDSIGGIIECTVANVPPGLGEPFYDSVESLVSHGVFSIPAIKGIEFGAGFKCAQMKGSDYNDEILDTVGKTKTNNSGGINGGITNGNDIVFRVAVRPASSIAKQQKTIDLKTEKVVSFCLKGRHDACITLRMPIVIEAITALVVADMMLVHGALESLR